MEKKIIRRVVPELQNGFKCLHPVLQRIYLARNVNSPDELTHELKNLLPYSSLLNIDKAVARLTQALKDQQQIIVIGDFDADGATSTALTVSALHAFGMENVSYLVPNRFAYGYGLTPEIVDLASSRRPDLIITVDNGISSHAGVAHANQLGIDVIITDHHLQGETVPPAYAIVNPNCKDDPFPSKCLAGVGVAFYLMLALRAELKKINWFERRGLECPNMAKFLDFVALGTIADIVPLDRNNRILVHQGLRRIRAGQAHPGILALLEVSGRPREKLRATDLGFGIGPRLNAAGRLDDMSLGVACLLADNLDAALDIAYRLDDLNKERRVIESQMQKEAFDAIDGLNLNNGLPPALCLYQEEWHQGVVGLVASRVKERTHRPTIVFAKMNDSTLKGSARSVSGLHIRNVLEAIAIKHPGLVTKFGGHAMAAGLSLPLERFDEFKEAFSREVNERLDEDDLQPRLVSDGELTSNELTLELALLMHEGGPWGQDFPEPLFDGRFKLINQRVVGQRHLKLILQVPDSNYYLDGIAFHADLEQWPNFHCEYAHLAYRLDVNEFQGRRKLQLLVEHIRAC
ncbi:single-stranded-DNA-specific exonuclease RecJ [Coxiella burnetii]|uniref:Single-stranded-DNA-specific exonuclease RecJ n=2 Tax=Coxiella burnetii TaxID=777 RepID=Q83E28_COXBU|nr:single-stranded-DNA-specific exonuclease RecJ [Coxiella burnetii]NP_819540.1 single-stranded-DNA-specific exonuclease [Coxiella burnetii RSA 493]AAO90054.1 single-stranded-DNA-specific exonuclease [Coxiella burnetii RSA 493]ABS77734.1 single-stranded-DNA-specific exonuclease [Coxiella burnetii Dugway 5J108-111]ACJ20526.1 single-stranded-DNA-specific exonuclease [Coxiella burnetii CbuK_Q154]ARI65382.1 single-stranded-DNA-specific exonuclease [Coxiella burnetii]ARK26861.1 single-stranded-DNA